MADDEGRISVPDDVAEPETQESFVEDAAEDVSAPEEPPKVVIPTAEELEAIAEQAASAEGRLKAAEPHYVPSWERHVMVGPATGFDMFKSLFDDGLLAGGMDMSSIAVDEALLRKIIISGVVQPTLSDTMLQNLLKRSARDFFDLVGAVMVMTQKDEGMSLAQVMGAMDTGAVERFTAAQDGSMSMRTPA